MTDRRRTSVYLDGFAHENPVPAACRIGDLICSGLITGRDPETGRPAGTLARQANLMFGNLRAVVEAAGATTDDIIKVTLYLKDRADREAVNSEWVAMFPDPDNRPARQALAADLDGAHLVQCDFIAVAAGSRPTAADDDRPEERGWPPIRP